MDKQILIDYKNQILKQQCDIDEEIQNMKDYIAKRTIDKYVLIGSLKTLELLIDEEVENEENNTTDNKGKQ